MNHEQVIQTAIRAAKGGDHVVLVTTPRADRSARMRLNDAAHRTTNVDGTAHFESGGWVRPFREPIHAAGVACDLRLHLVD